MLTNCYINDELIPSKAYKRGFKSGKEEEENSEVKI